MQGLIQRVAALHDLIERVLRSLQSPFGAYTYELL